MRSSSVLPLLLVCFATFSVLLQPYEARASYFTIPESKLLDSEFSNKAWGPASVVRTDAPGDAVDFAFTGLSDSGTGLKDDCATWTGCVESASHSQENNVTEQMLFTSMRNL